MDHNPVKWAFVVLLGLAVLSVLPFGPERGPTLEAPGVSLIPADQTNAAVVPGRDPFQAAIGLNACRQDTGAFAGKISGVHYGDQGLRYYSLSLVERVERIPDGRGGRIEVEVYPAGKRALSLAELFNVTDGRCPDGRP